MAAFASPAAADQQHSPPAAQSICQRGQSSLIGQAHSSAVEMPGIAESWFMASRPAPGRAQLGQETVAAIAFMPAPGPQADIQALVGSGGGHGGKESLWGRPTITDQEQGPRPPG